MNAIGILAYGSLITDPGIEVDPLIGARIATVTPFPVEYVRLSDTRSGAPTLAPHSTGKPVRGGVLLFASSVPIEEAKSLLWRRETRMEGSGRAYKESTSPNAVVIRNVAGLCGLDHVLYTDFNPAGKIGHPNARELAEAAIASVRAAPAGKDGISYLMERLTEGVETTLTAQYQK